MKFLKYLTLATLAAAFAATSVLAQDEKEKKEAPRKGGDPAARFVRLDKDKDDHLSLEELKAGMKRNPDAADKMMKVKDTDKDGKLSKDEFTAKPARKKGDGNKKKEAE